MAWRQRDPRLFTNTLKIVTFSLGLLLTACACCFCPNQSLSLNSLSHAWPDRLDISGCVVACGRTGLHWLHIHSAARYWTLAPDAGSAQYCTRARIWGPNNTFYVLITDELNCSSPAESAASCALWLRSCAWVLVDEAFGTSVQRARQRCWPWKQNHSGRPRVCGVQSGATETQQSKPTFTAVDLRVPRLNPSTLKNTPLLVFSFILYQRKAVIPGSSQGRQDLPVLFSF